MARQREALQRLSSAAGRLLQQAGRSAGASTLERLERELGRDRGE